MEELFNLEEHIGKPALLEQTAEEAVELAHACLKLARKLRGENFTPKTMQECVDDLVEEASDVWLCLEQLIFNSNTFSPEALESVMMTKQQRMEERFAVVVNEDKEPQWESIYKKYNADLRSVEEAGIKMDGK